MTLIEVLVATVILGIGVTGLLSAATLATRYQRRSESRMQALYVAQERLAEIEISGAHAYLLGRPMNGESQVGTSNYIWTVRIEQQPVGELFVVQVNVSGEGKEGGQAELTTWLNDYEAKSQIPKEQREKTGPEAANATPGGAR